MTARKKPKQTKVKAEISEAADTSNEIGDRMRRWRARRGLSQREAAAILNFPRKSWENWEEKRTTPRLAAAMKILDCLQKAGF